MRRLRGSPVAIGLSALLLAAPVAASPDSPEPEPADMARAIEAAPELDTARAQLDSAQAMAHIETTSARPWVARGGTQNRQVTGEPDFSGDPNYREWDVSVEHDVRLPGKRSLDRSVAAAQITRAQAILDETQRAVTLAVLEDWYHCVSAAARVKRAADDRNTVSGLRDSVEKRLSAGDASQLDATLANAELAGVQAELSAASEELRTAQELLVVRALPPSCASANLKGAPAAPSRTAIDPARDPAVRLAAAGVELATAQAERSRAERMPDPTVGIRYARERGGLERVAGLYFSVPLPGGRASAEADHAAAMARVAQSERRQTEWKAATRINTVLSRLRTARAQWPPLDEAARLQSDAAQRLQRAHSLGEVDMAVALQALRTARSARALADDALIEFWQAESVIKAHHFPSSSP